MPILLLVATGRRQIACCVEELPLNELLLTSCACAQERLGPLAIVVLWLVMPYVLAGDY